MLYEVAHVTGCHLHVKDVETGLFCSLSVLAVNRNGTHTFVLTRDLSGKSVLLEGLTVNDWPILRSIYPWHEKDDILKQFQNMSPDERMQSAITYCDAIGRTLRLQSIIDFRLHDSTYNATTCLPNWFYTVVSRSYPFEAEHLFGYPAVAALFEMEEEDIASIVNEIGLIPDRWQDEQDSTPYLSLTQVKQLAAYALIINIGKF